MLKTSPPKTVLHSFLLGMLMATNCGWRRILVPQQKWYLGKPSKKWRYSPSLRPSFFCLKAYGDHTINHKGKVILTCKANQREDTVDFYVAMTKAPPILGLQACEKLALTERTDFPQEQPKQERPSVDAVTSASFHLSKTDVLEEFLGVFTGLGKFDLCLDPKDLNSVIRREHFQIPTFQDVVSCLGGKKYFTVLDQNDSYWEVPLSEESSYLCTPFDRYHFLRMPFGISSASEVL